MMAEYVHAGPHLVLYTNLEFVCAGPADMSITTVDIEYVYDEAGDLRQIRTTWVPVVSWCMTYCIRWSMLVTGFSNTSISIKLYMYVYEAFDIVHVCYLPATLCWCCFLWSPEQLHSHI